MRKIHLNMESVDKELGFGKYEDTTLWDIIHMDLDYMMWLVVDCKYVEFSPVLREFIKEVYKQYDDIYHMSAEKFTQIYIEYLEKEKNQKKVSCEKKKELSCDNGIQKKADLSDENVQKELLRAAVNYFNSRNMEADTESGILQWKKIKDIKENDNRTLYFKAIYQGTPIILLEELCGGTPKITISMALLSPNRSLKYTLRVEDRGNMLNLYTQIKKQLSL